MKNIDVQTRQGTLTTVDTVIVHPVSQSVSWIGRNLGFVWNRPSAVRVEEGDNVRQIPIRDYTQIGLAVLYGLTFMFGLMAIRKSITNTKRR